MDKGLRRIVIVAGLIALVGTLIGCAARPVLVPSASAPAPTAATPSASAATPTRAR
jgi:hypothetical protein